MKHHPSQAQEDVLAANQSRATTGLISMFSMIGGAIAGAWAHNPEKHQEVARAKELLSQGKLAKQMRSIMPDMNEPWSGKKMGPSSRSLKTAQSILDGHGEIGSLWHSFSKSGKAFTGAILSMLIIGPIAEFIVSRRAMKKAEDTRMEAIEHGYAADHPASDKSFTGALASERESSQGHIRS
jgi:hypothetical protein